MKAKFILFMYKRGLICHELFTSWNNPEGKEKEVEDVLSVITQAHFFTSLCILLSGLVLIFCGYNFFSPRTIPPSVLIGALGFVVSVVATSMWWHRQTLINNFVDLESLLTTQQGHYVLNLDYTAIKKLAQDCLRYLGSQLRAAESHSGVDARPARRARRKFKMAHRVFLAFGLVNKNQGEYVN